MTVDMYFLQTIDENSITIMTQAGPKYPPLIVYLKENIMMHFYDSLKISYSELFQFNLIRYLLH